MKFISLATWRDLSDGHLYHEGDSFPFDGREVDKGRLQELVSGHNRAGLVLLRAVDEPKAEAKGKEPEKAPEVPEKPKASRARRTTAKK